MSERTEQGVENISSSRALTLRSRAKMLDIYARGQETVDIDINISANQRTRFLSDILRPRVVGSVLGMLALVIAANVGLKQFAEEGVEERIRGWNSDISDVLNNPHILREGQRFYPEVKIVGAGRDFYEKVKMDEDKELVNVRRGAGGRDILGTVPVGSRARDVVLQGDWAGTYCRNIEGLVLKNPSKPLDSNQVCAIHDIYVENASK